MAHLEEVARRVAPHAKMLHEASGTGAKKYRYVRTGEDHYSLAFTYALMAMGLGMVRPALVTLVREDADLWPRRRNGYFGYVETDITDEEIQRKLMGWRAEPGEEDR